MILRPLLNRDDKGAFALPADGWFQLVPVGEFAHAPTSTTQVIDRQAIQAMAHRFKQEGKEVRIDYDHFSYDDGKSSIAAGWIANVEARDNGLWAQIRLSSKGREDIEGGNYRFVSPAWLRAEVEELGNNRIRPLRLDSAGLTNNPNLRGMVPLSNRTGGAPAEHNTTKKRMMNRLMETLGLSADANEDSALNALNTLSNRLAEAEKKNGTLEGELKNSNAQLGELLKAQVEVDLAKYANRIGKDGVEKWRSELLSNRARAIELLEVLPVRADGGTSGQQAMLHRQSTATPSTEGAASREQSVKNAAEAQRLASEYARNNGISFDQAWNYFQQAKPELFR